MKETKKNIPWSILAYLLVFIVYLFCVVVACAIVAYILSSVKQLLT